VAAAHRWKPKLVHIHIGGMKLDEAKRSGAKRTRKSPPNITKSPRSKKEN
jgi:hypothetical protein